MGNALLLRPQSLIPNPQSRDRRELVVGEPHVLEDDAARGAAVDEVLWCGGLRERLVVVQQVEDALAGGQGALQRVELVREVAHRLEEHADVLHERDQRTDRHGVAHGLSAAEPQHAAEGHVRDHAHHGPEQREVEHRLDVRVPVCAVDVFEAALLLGLAPEDLDH